MSFAQYKEQVAQNKQWQEKYLQMLPDTGIVTPRSFNELPQPATMPRLSTNQIAAGETAPLYTNPSAGLYTQGSMNVMLFSAGSDMCDQGCFSGINKPDPRLKVVKPLYNQSVFKAGPGQLLPGPYNVVGMYN